MESCIRTANETWDFSTFKIFIVTVSVGNRHLYASNQLIGILNLCYSRLSADYYVQHKTNMGFKVAFNIKIYGCSSNSSEITPFIRFWEAIHNWAKTETRMVFMDTAYEDTSLYLNNSLECFKDNDVRNSIACDCGWWKVFPQNMSSNLSYIVKDKKSSNLFWSKISRHLCNIVSLFYEYLVNKCVILF